MKKTLFTIILGAFGVMAIVTPAFAATSMSFTPVKMSVSQGQIFTLTIGLNPQGTKIYTVKTELRYPADLLEIQSFTFANGWTALSQSGYDLIDNPNGMLIKTAGYPSGISSPITFGTVSFLAKKSGNGTITLNNSDSLALDANSRNVLAGASVQTAVVISVPTTILNQTTPKTPTTPISSVIVPQKEKPTIPVAQKTPLVQGQPNAPQPIAIASQSLLASVGSAVTYGTDNIIIGILVVLAILALIGYEIYLIIQRERRKNLGKLN